MQLYQIAQKLFEYLQQTRNGVLSLGMHQFCQSIQQSNSSPMKEWISLVTRQFEFDVHSVKDVYNTGRYRQQFQNRQETDHHHSAQTHGCYYYHFIRIYTH